MQTVELENDINLFCVKAKSFPQGIRAAFDELERLAPAPRKLFGISHGSAAGIVYFAGTDEATDALKKAGIPFTLKKGTYRAVDIPGVMHNPMLVGKTFQQLTALPELDPEGCCVEMYLNDTDVRCMVRVIAAE